MKVQVKNLRKEFGKTVAVDNISFSFDSGHVFGFVGPNGAGKTTTMRIISTVEEPTSGDVLLNGISTVSYTHLTAPRRARRLRLPKPPAPTRSSPDVRALVLRT